MSITQGQIAINLLREQIQFAHNTLEGTLESVTPEIATVNPPGLARSIGSYYAHILIVEDLAINGLLQQKAPLFAAEWREQTGFDSLPPADSAQWLAWTSQAHSNVSASRAYGQAVFAATTEYLAGLTDSDLINKIDLSGIGFGEQTVGWLISVFVLTNCSWHTGEISCLKGDHGLAGYPF